MYLLLLIFKLIEFYEKTIPDNISFNGSQPIWFDSYSRIMDKICY